MPLATDYSQTEPYLWATEGAYVFLLVRNGIPSLSPDESIVLTPPPTAIDQTYEPGTMIQPTQSERFWVEGLGLQSHTINISGSSFVFGARSPFDQSEVLPPGAARSAGLAQSGYTLFHKFKRFYESYQKEVARGFPSGLVEMHFFNTKDGEFYHVEPLQFRVPRTAGKPLQYPYQLQLRVLGSSALGAGVAAFAKVSTLVKMGLYYEKLATLSFLGPAIVRDVKKSFAAVGESVKSSVTRFSQDLRNILVVMDALNDGHIFTATGTDTIAGGFAEAARAIQRARRNGAISAGLASLGAGLETFTPTNNRMQKLMAPVTPILDSTRWANTTTSACILIENEFHASFRPAPLMRVDIFNPQLDVYGMSIDARIAADQIIADAPIGDAGFDDGPDDMLRDMHTRARRGEGQVDAGMGNELAAIDSEITDNRGASPDLPISGAALQVITKWPDLVSNVVPASLGAFLRRIGVVDPATYSGVYKRVEVSSVHDIWTFAHATLGSWQRWVEIVELNGLSYPYISADGAAGTVKYGDTLLVPTSDPILTKDLVERLERTRLKFDRLSIRDIYLGLDVAVDPVSGDLLTDQAGHPMFIAGVVAFAQNMAGRLSTMLGTYLPNAAYGVGVRVGQKANPLLLSIWKAMLSATIRSDERVLEIQKITLVQEADAITYDIRLALREINEAVTVSGRLA